VRAYGLNPSVVYFHVGIRDVWKENMRMRCEIQIENIRPLGFRDRRDICDIKEVDVMECRVYIFKSRIQQTRNLQKA
jgi:hypothetical protein